MEASRGGRRHWLAGTPFDRALLALAVFASLAGWFAVQSSLGHGVTMARIYHGETLLAEYPLNESGQPIHIHADGDLGESHIIIDDQGAHFVSSPCSGQQCVQAGSRHEAGKALACVPNRILVSLQSADDSSGFDAVTE
ncbi:MAG: NusG domain II-containing protein [Mariprofundaceae bacterium]